MLAFVPSLYKTNAVALAPQFYTVQVVTGFELPRQSTRTCFLSCNPRNGRHTYLPALIPQSDPDVHSLSSRVPGLYLVLRCWRAVSPAASPADVSPSMFALRAAFYTSCSTWIPCCSAHTRLSDSRGPVLALPVSPGVVSGIPPALHAQRPVRLPVTASPATWPVASLLCGS